MRVLPSSGQSRMSPGVQLSLVLHLSSMLVLALGSVTALSTQLQGTVPPRPAARSAAGGRRQHTRGIKARRTHANC